MTEGISDEIADFFGRLADVAESVQKHLGWFLGIGAAMSLVLAFRLFNPESALWWNTLKCGLVLLPSLIWCLIWFLLSQVREAPELIASLAEEKDLSMASLKAHAANPKPGLISLFSTIRELRNNDAFDIVTDAIGSITLLANPIFMIMSFAMLAVLFTFILVTPILLIW